MPKIIPLSDTLLNNLQTTKFNHEILDKGQCCICLSEYQDNQLLVNLPCKHFYHDECAKKWFKITDSCPLCRKKIE